MPIINVEKWNKCQEVNNQDPYGKCIVDVAREVMRMLDADSAPITDPHKMVCDADDNIKAGGITGFMAGAVASIVSGAHSRGEEFRRAWNKDTQLGSEGDKANESGGVLNPALLNIG